MDPYLNQWLKTLSFAQIIHAEGKEADTGIKAVAKIYEAARNALEYRADHLVKRAAIERIMKRELTLSRDAEVLADHLDQELRWVDYTSQRQEDKQVRSQVIMVIQKYQKYLDNSGIDRDLLMGMMSAEMETVLNPNPDYHKFNQLAFGYFRKRIQTVHADHLDLYLLAAVEKVYGQSDDQRTAYRLFELMARQAGNDSVEVLKKTEKLFKQAKESPITNKLSILVRKDMGALVLIRDMYFAHPKLFVECLEEEDKFKYFSEKVLDEQLEKLGKRTNTAMFRSLVYVFLTKMVFGFGIEIPAEKWFSGSVQPMALVINLLFPVFLMWLLAANVRLPNEEDRKRLIEKAWETISHYSLPAPEEEVVKSLEKRTSTVKRNIFYLFYGLLFGLSFSLVIWSLWKIGFNAISMVIFMFFLCVVSFFAFRVKQMAMQYQVRKSYHDKSSLLETLLLPMVAVGGWLSKEVSRLNFLVFIFDFILEAPLKTILRFLESWLDFLSAKKEEITI